MATSIDGEDKRPIQETECATMAADVDEARDDIRGPPGTMVEDALSCVMWDESVDFERLLTLEYAHDVAYLKKAVALAARRMDARRTSRSAPSLSLGGVAYVVGYQSQRVSAKRIAQLWGLHGPGGRLHALDNDGLVEYLAVAARHPDFHMSYSLGPNDEGWTTRPDGEPCFDKREHTHWKDMWLARLVKTLLRRTQAWTGVEIVRLRSLSQALLALLRARIEHGPLAAVSYKDTVVLDQTKAPLSAHTFASLSNDPSLDQPSTTFDDMIPDCDSTMAKTPESDLVVGRNDGAPTAARQEAAIQQLDTVLATMRSGLARAKDIHGDAEIWRDGAPAGVGEAYGTTHRSSATLCMLKSLFAATERLYATDVCFSHLIKSAEYKGIREGMAGAASVLL